MSSSYLEPSLKETRIRDLPLDDSRGIYAMWCVIATEASLFACLFGAYFYLGNSKDRWTNNQPPALHYAWIMLGVLVLSACILRWGESRIKQERYGAARVALLVTLICGLGFLTLEYFDYRAHLVTLTPRSDAYGSIFYVISGLHVLHVIAGVLILVFTLCLPRYSPASEAPYRPYQTAALYWYFVNVLWISVFVILYLIPNLITHA